MRSLAVVVVVAACGGAAKPPPAVVGNTGPTGPAEPAEPAGDPVTFDLAGTPWAIDVPTAQHTQPDEYTHRFTTPAWTIDVVEWPDSQVFVQTADEHIQSVTKDGDTVLHQRIDGPHAWAVVSTGKAKISGAVSIAGPQLTAMCSFDLPTGADWKPALEACGKVHSDVVEEGDE